MIHGRQCGESFGLSIGEFNVFNKPIITCITRRHNAHISFLGKKGIYYPNPYGDYELDKKLPNPPQNLYIIFKCWNNENIKNKNWNAYSEFEPKNVMRKFNKIFLKD